MSEPTRVSSCQWELIEHPEDINAVAAELAGTSPLAIDVERASGFTYTESACLVQVATSDQAQPVTIFDTLADGFDPEVFRSAFEDRPWILHSASSDLPSLRALSLHGTSLFDTELAGRLLGLERVNLGAMHEAYLDISLAKAHSSANWSRRPLPDSWLDYAALDVRYLHQIVDLLTTELTEAGRLDWFTAECDYLLHKRAPEPLEDPWRKAKNRALLKKRRDLESLKQLWNARDEIARELDWNPKRVAPDALLVDIVLAQPTSVSTLRAVKGLSKKKIVQYSPQLWAALQQAQDTAGSDLPILRPKSRRYPPHGVWRQHSVDAADLLVQLREVIAGIVDPLGIAPEILIKPDAIRDIAWFSSQDDSISLEDTIENAFNLWEVRPWQQELVREPVLGLLNEFFES